MGRQPGPDGEPLPDDRGDAAGAGADELTIGQLARRSGLSRGTLLYYDRIGVLCPSSRSPAGYRRYSPADATRLAWICRYRRAGLPLTAIKELLDGAVGDQAGTLAARLTDLNDELRRVRGQQRFILDLLGRDPRYESLPFLNRATFTRLLESAGVSADQQERLHVAFERAAQDEHQAFLEFLCFDDTAIADIRRRSARPTGADGCAPPP